VSLASADADTAPRESPCSRVTALSSERVRGVPLLLII
jgi:hypothetical protein